jgi:hypothetical protein
MNADCYLIEAWGDRQTEFVDLRLIHETTDEELTWLSCG